MKILCVALVLMASTYAWKPPGTIEGNEQYHESNRLVSWVKSAPKQAALGAAIDVGALVLVHKLLSQHHPKLLRRALYVGTVVRFSYAAWNVQLK